MKQTSESEFSRYVGVAKNVISGYPSSVYGLIFFFYSLSLDLQSRLRFPPGKDQDSYLEAGREVVERFAFMVRAPLYSLWMGLFYIFSGYSLKAAFYLEKNSSIFFLACVIAILGYKLFDFRTGLLLGIWTLNCKYLISETNGTHTLIAVLFTISLICLLFDNIKPGIPLAMFMLFLATQVRKEMAIPLVSIIIFGTLMAIYKWLSGKSTIRVFLKRSEVYWIIAIAAAVSIGILFSLRPGFVGPQLVNQAFIENTAINLVERKGLIDRYPQPWLQVTEIWQQELPRATDAKTFLRNYPDEFRGHVFYNLKLFVRAIIVNILAFDNPLLMLGALMAYLASYLIRKRPDKIIDPWDSLDYDRKALICVWCLSLLWLIPMTLVFRVAARYYIPLIPAQMLMIVIIARALIKKR